MLSRIRKRQAFLALAVLAAVLALSACARNVPEGAGHDPVTATRDFIVDAAVDHNGYEACGYLTLRQQRAAARRVGASECRQASISPVSSSAASASRPSTRWRVWRRARRCAAIEPGCG
jgi:hypothetical protein